MLALQGGGWQGTFGHFSRLRECGMWLAGIQRRGPSGWTISCSAGMIGFRKKGVVPFRKAQVMKISKKEALLQAAKELFGEYGYVETTFKKISDRAGVALGLLTHHYGSKEKLFLAAGLDVLERFILVLEEAVARGENGYACVLNFCQAYLHFSVDPHSNWLVLVRCSPYSDMKTKSDRDLMNEKFNQVPQLLERCLEQGIQDGSINASLHPRETAQVIMGLMVGANRTRVLTPYAPPGLYEEALSFIARSIRKEAPEERL